ncbi:MAG: hypothetical protein IJ566_02205 [Cardiobacteriaceae bacterium]|nr:hypothetical protein [Cardiobacteriaceae bacterium]
MYEAAFKIRKRTKREAINLGITFARRFFLDMWLASLPCWMGIFSICLLVYLTNSSLDLALFLFWLLRPLAERPAIYCLSRRAMQLPYSFAEAQKKIFARGWFLEITFLRLFVPSRITRHSVRILEGKTVKKISQRIASFSDLRGQMFAVANFFAYVESTVAVSMLLIFALGVPGQEGQWDAFFIFLKNAIQSPEIFALPLFITATTGCVFFSCVGFAAYLNHRIIEEGWAISLSLQELAKKWKNQKAQSFKSAAIFTAFVVACLFFTPNSVEATEINPEIERQKVQEIIDEPSIRPYKFRSPREEIPTDEPSQFNLRNFDSPSISQILRILLLICAVLFIAFLIIKILDSRLPTFERTKNRRNPSSAQINREITEEQNYCDELDLAFQYLHAGETVKALAVIYSRFVHMPEKHHLPRIMRSECESEYLRRNGEQISRTSRDFIAKFFAFWQSAAYAHNPPAKESVENLIHQYRQIWY